MTTTGRAPTLAPVLHARPKSTLRTVGLPVEHGGWSLTLEPVILGLLVAWSLTGVALGAVAMVAFMARTPLKVVVVDRWRHRWLDRTRVAARLVAVELGVLVVLAGVAALNADARFWVPLAVAAPLVGVELWFDMRSRSRRLVPELAGTIGIGSMAAAIALAGGIGAAVAVGLWSVVAARSVAAMPYVRTQLLRGRHKPHRLWRSDLAQVLAATTVTVSWVAGALPFAPVVAMAVIAAINLTAVRLRPRPAVVIGIQQTIFGLAVIAVTAAVLAA